MNAIVINLTLWCECYFEFLIIITVIHERSFFMSLFITQNVVANRHEQDRCQGASESGELRRRIKQLEEENEEMSDNRLELIGKIITDNTNT